MEVVEALAPPALRRVRAYAAANVTMVLCGARDVFLVDRCAITPRIATEWLHALRTTGVHGAEALGVMTCAGQVLVVHRANLAARLAKPTAHVLWTDVRRSAAPGGEVRVRRAFISTLRANAHMMCTQLLGGGARGAMDAWVAWARGVVAQGGDDITPPPQACAVAAIGFLLGYVTPLYVGDGRAQSEVDARLVRCAYRSTRSGPAEEHVLCAFSCPEPVYASASAQIDAWLDAWRRVGEQQAAMHHGELAVALHEPASTPLHV